MVVLMVFVLTVCVPTNALGCYLDKESAIYCNDVTLNEALSEAEYMGKQLDTVYYYSNSCSEIEECELVICKDSCTMDVRGLCEYGVATKDSCQMGCCQTENTCEEMDSEMDCIVRAKSENSDLYSYSSGDCNCAMATDYEIVEKDEPEYVVNNDPLIYNVPEVLEIDSGDDGTENTSTKLVNIDGEPVSFPYIPVALGAVLVFLYFVLKGSSSKTVYHQKNSGVTVKIPPKRYKPRQPPKRKHYVSPKPVLKHKSVPRPTQTKTKESLNAIDRIRRTEELRAILRRKRN